VASSLAVFKAVMRENQRIWSNHVWKPQKRENVEI